MSDDLMSHVQTVGKAVRPSGLLVKMTNIDKQLDLPPGPSTTPSTLLGLVGPGWFLPVGWQTTGPRRTWRLPRRGRCPSLPLVMGRVVE